MQTFIENEKLTRLAAGAVAAQTDVESTGLDMVGFDSAVFIGLMGAIDPTGVVVMHLEQSSDNGVADGWSDLEGTAASATADDDDGLLVIEVRRPLLRFVRAVIARGTADSVIDGILAIQRDPQRAPVTQSTDVIDSVLLGSPAEGTP